VRPQFIYVSMDEMAAVADFIKKRGRVAIGELAAKSNTLIDLEQHEAELPAGAVADFDLAEFEEGGASGPVAALLK
jgi:DDRGK domain-containing protein 1